MTKPAPRKLQILMPMGGLGKRFSDQGFKLPKPLIPVDGQPMFQKALSSFDGLGTKVQRGALVSVFRKEHQEQFQLGDRLRAADTSLKVVLIDQPTRGAVETCLFAEKLIAPEDGLVILDCDLWFDAPEYLDFVAQDLTGTPGPWAGALPCFESSLPRYSFVKLRGDEVVDIAEKNPISDRAVLGAYFFSRASIFFEAAHALLNEPLTDTSEYYVSLAYKRLLGAGHRFRSAKAARYDSFGTPEELAAYQARN